MYTTATARTFRLQNATTVRVTPLADGAAEFETARNDGTVISVVRIESPSAVDEMLTNLRIAEALRAV